MTNTIYIATSLDGYIATEEGELDWLDEIPNPDKSDFGFAEFMSRVDALVMGRHTFEKVVSFDAWPYDKPVFVLSQHLTRVPAGYEGKAKIIKGDARAIVERLNSQGYQNLYIDGGKVIQSFLTEDLIDEMIITRVPILLGGGIPLFGRLPRVARFRHIETKIHNDTLVMSRYLRNF